MILIPGYGQNLESIGKDDPIRINGGLSFSQILYKADGFESRRDPYSYFLTGNLTTSIYGFSIPLSFSVSNQSRSFQQPFNQFSLNPTYKWATAHVGYSTMSFSPYTLSGHIFRGAGIELKPKKLHFSAMYGEMRRASQGDSVRGTSPTFARRGMGFKTGYSEEGNFAELSVFHGADDVTSLAQVPRDNSMLPEENLAVGVSLGKQLFKKLSIEGEYTTSAVTRDSREKESSSDSLRWTERLIRSNITTDYFHTYRGSLNYQLKQYTIGGKYERIDPGYRTHGAYFFNSDLENITVQFAGNWFDNKLTLNSSAGIQHDNLDRTKISTLSRMVGSINASFAPNERVSMTGSYSNFQSFTNVRSQFVQINQLTPYDNLDTLRFTQISQSVNLGLNYQLKASASRQQFITLAFSVQDAADRQTDVTQNSGSRFYNLNTTYSLSLVPTKVNLGFSYNVSQNSAPDSQMLIHGPTFSLNKSLLENKLRLTVSSSYNETSASNLNTNRLVNLRTMASYRVGKRHNLTGGLVALQRTAPGSEAARYFREYTGTFTYNYSF